MSTVKIIAKRSLSNGVIGVTFRANDDPASDSVGTYYTAGKTQADAAAWVEQEKARVAAEYEAHQGAHSILASLE